MVASRRSISASSTSCTTRSSAARRATSRRAAASWGCAPPPWPALSGREGRVEAGMAGGGPPLAAASRTACGAESGSGVPKSSVRALMLSAGGGCMQIAEPQIAISCACMHAAHDGRSARGCDANYDCGPAEEAAWRIWVQDLVGRRRGWRSLRHALLLCHWWQGPPWRQQPRALAPCGAAVKTTHCSVKYNDAMCMQIPKAQYRSGRQLGVHYILTWRWLHFDVRRDQSKQT